MTWPKPLLFVAAVVVVLALGFVVKRLWDPNLHSWQKAVVVLGFAAGAAFAVSVMVVVWNRPDYCHYGLRLEVKAGQCVGVSDGSYTFDRAQNPAMDKVTQLIGEENAAAEKSKSTVTVAFMLPMTSDNDSERRQILREVQGAYLAQRQANQVGRLGERTPDIRLVLANPGQDYAAWETVTDRLRGMAGDSKYPLRAVVGFNLSVKNTEDALHTLTAAGVPVVGGPLTADEMENVRKNGVQRFPGMARTVPTNSAQASALVHFNKNTKPKDAALVVDIRANDTYNASLAAAFSKAVSPRTKPKEFESKSPTDEGNVANQFGSMVDSICYSGAKDIYFAGRPAHLRLFLLELADRPCGKQALRVITGSGASTVSLYLTGKDWDRLKGNEQLTLQYAAVGHPQMWAKGDFGAAGKFYTDTQHSPASVMREAVKEAGELRARLGEPVRWEDSRAMSAFDSVWLAANALKGLPPGPDDHVPSLEDVRGQWRNTYADKGVPGATGWLCLDNDGNPYNKAVAVVTLDQTDRSVCFEGMGWPKGAPSPNCDVPKEG
ncbi:amino acid ABC transporter substrate-binding protein [Streptomyces sp. NPDC048442]|uniref:ABC transporter substrate-binding protein n=1 Tax=Streptomyces sp. NPDC048442 TaxID=3154823 RepID=UPI0034197E5F